MSWKPGGGSGVSGIMKPDWLLRQLLAILRGLDIMVAAFLILIFFQLVPALFRGGFSGVHERIVRVATAGVTPERWSVAVTRMYMALATVLVFGCVLYVAQRCLGRKLRKNAGHA